MKSIVFYMNNETILIIYRQLSVNRIGPRAAKRQCSAEAAKSSMSSKIGYGFPSLESRLGVATSVCKLPQALFASDLCWQQQEVRRLCCCIHALTHALTHSFIHSFIDRSVLRANVCNRIFSVAAAISQSCLSALGYMIRLFIVLWLGY